MTHPLQNPNISPDDIWEYLTCKDGDLSETSILLKSKYADEADKIAAALHANPALPLLALEDPYVGAVRQWVNRVLWLEEHRQLNAEIYESQLNRSVPLEQVCEALAALRPLLGGVHPLIRSSVEIYLDFGPIGCGHRPYDLSLDVFGEEYRTWAALHLATTLNRLHNEGKLRMGSDWERREAAENRQIPLDHVSYWELNHLEHARWMLAEEHMIPLDFRGSIRHLPIERLEESIIALRLERDELLRGLPARREWIPAYALQAARSSYDNILARKKRPGKVELVYSPYEAQAHALLRLGRLSGVSADGVLKYIKKTATTGEAHATESA